MNIWLKSLLIAFIVGPIITIVKMEGSTKMWVAAILYMACSFIIDLIWGKKQREDVNLEDEGKAE